MYESSMERPWWSLCVASSAVVLAGTPLRDLGQELPWLVMAVMSSHAFRLEELSLA